jgi:hypothetical protein
MWCVVIAIYAKCPIASNLLEVEYYGLTPGAERDIFQRVQLGMALTAAG